MQTPELILAEASGSKYDASVDVFALGLAFEVIFDYSPEYTILCPLSGILNYNHLNLLKGKC